MPGRKSGPSPQQIAAAPVYSLPQGWSKQTLEGIPRNCRLDDETIGVLKVAMAAGELTRAQVNVFKLSFTQECKVRGEVRGVGRAFLDTHGRAITEDLKPLKGTSMVGTSQYSCETILFDSEFRERWVSWGFPDPIQFQTEAVEDCSGRVIGKTSVLQLKSTITKALNDLEALARLDKGLGIEADIPQFLQDSRKEFIDRFAGVAKRKDDRMSERTVQGSTRRYGTSFGISDSIPLGEDLLDSNEDQDVMKGTHSRYDKNITQLGSNNDNKDIRASNRSQALIISDDNEEDNVLSSQPGMSSLGLDNHSRRRSFDFAPPTRGNRRNTGSQSYQREKSHRRTVSAVQQMFSSNDAMPQRAVRRSDPERSTFVLVDTPRRGSRTSRGKASEKTGEPDPEAMNWSM